MQQPGALAVRTRGRLAPDGAQEPPIEAASREITQCPRPDGVDECVTDPADVQCCRPIEEDGLDPVLERYGWLHVQDDRDRDAVSVAGQQALSLEKAACDLGTFD